MAEIDSRQATKPFPVINGHIGLVDSHCHLDFPDFADDKLDQVLARAKTANVRHMLTISTRLETFANIKKIANAYDHIFCSVGIHPHNAHEEGDATVADLIALAKAEKVIGIGETGLDYFYEHSPKDIQIKQFRNHIAAARDTGLPIIVHTRDADDDTVDILSDEYKKGPFKGLIHCFSSTPALAEKVLDMGFYISVSGIATFKKADDLRETLSNVPLNRLLVETDAPYLAPMPMRGKPNEPAFTAFTAAKLADIKSTDIEVVARQTTENFFALFSKAVAVKVAP